MRRHVVLCRRIMQGRSGLTLIEILIALTVMTLGIVGLLAIFPVAINNTNKAADDSQVTILAKSIQAAVLDGIESGIVVHDDDDDLDYLMMPFRYHGVPYESPASYDGTITMEDEGTNTDGIYWMALPLNTSSFVADEQADKETRNYWFWPRVDDNGNPLDTLQKEQAPKHVFYIGLLGEGGESTNIPSQMGDFVNTGREEELSKDPFGQFAYRIEAWMVVEKVQDEVGGPEENKIVKGLWQFDVFLYRGYLEEFAAEAGKNFSNDKNLPIKKFSFQAVIG